MHRISRVIALCLITTSAICNNAIAGGLSTTFVEVSLRDVTPGGTYSLKGVKGKALTIDNTTENITTSIAVEPEMPSEENLLPGYEPIPDLSWIRIEKNHFEKVGPGESAETDIFISIPEGDEYWGRRYQVYIYSHTTGSMMSVGLMGRLLIYTKEKPAGPTPAS